MKRKKQNIMFAFLCGAMLSSILLSGCGESKEAKTARLQGIASLESENYEEAHALFEQALAASDGVVDAFELDLLKYRGETEYRMEDYAAAAHTYGILAEVDEGKAEYLYYKAAAEAQAGDAEQGLADYEKAGTMENGEEATGAKLALSAVAEAVRAAGNTQQAIALCQKALERDSSDPMLYSQMAICQMEAGDGEEAIRYLEEGLTASGEEDGEVKAALQYNLGAAYEYQGDFAKALETFKTYAASYGETPELQKEIAFLESR